MNDLNICESTVQGWKTAGTVLYIIKVGIGLVVIITSIILFFRVIEKGNSVELTKALRGTVFKIFGVLIVFLVPTTIPTLINMLATEYEGTDMEACNECLLDPSGTRCNYYMDKYLEARKNDEIKEEKIVIEGNLNTCELSLGNAGASDFSYKGNGTVKSRFTSDTLRIVERHLHDFTYSNYHSYISSHGGVKNYIKGLGGVFSRNYGKTRKGDSVDDLIEASEYVFGIMQMYGFDYFNGKVEEDGRKYCKWGGGCLYYKDYFAAERENRLNEISYPTGAGDAFYPGQFRYDENGYSGPKNKFDKLLEGSNMTTNCNWSVDMVYFKAGIFGKGKGKGMTGGNYKRMGKKGEIIDRLCDIKVGDIIHFFRNSVDPTDPKTWKGWGHVAYVGEVNGKKHKIVVYDGGSKFTSRKNFKWSFKFDPSSNEWPKTLGGFKGYAIVRIKDLKD